MDYSRSPCASDYLEVRDVSNNRVVMTHCGGDPLSEEPIAIKVGFELHGHLLFVPSH